jgi:hypothetical protein
MINFSSCMHIIPFSRRHLLLGLLFLLISFSSSSNMIQASPAEMKLDIEGDVSHSYSESDIKQSLPVISGWGGMQKSSGTIIDPSFWKGVNIPLMFDSIVNDLDYNISIIASDGYNKNFTSQDVNGAIRAFNEENVTLNVTVIPVIAFEGDIETADGPLRLVFIGENNQSILTISALWVRQVDTIHIDIEGGITITITTTTQSSVETTPLNVVWLLVPTLIFLILYRRKK